MNLSPDRKKRWTLYAIVFGASAILLSLFAWNRVLGPSSHFHFLDLANSFLDGRLDTDTPRRFRGQAPRSEDPPGYQDAVNRHLTDGDGKGVGWNDWASIREITLTDGTEVKGVFPWSDQQGDQKNRFITLDGTQYVIDPELDIQKGCRAPGTRCDETKHYVSFPPFPAVAMMPGFLIWGYDFNDVLFTVLNGALNALLILMLLEFLCIHGLSRRSTRENVVLTVLFTFGTVHFFSAIRGEVWFSALILGVTLHTLYILFSVGGRRPFLAGLCLALGMATRTPIGFAAPFFLLELFRDGDRLRWPGWGPLVRKGVWFALPVLAVGIVLMIYNYARFESFGEFGHTFLANGTRPSIRDHGLMSFWFLKNNLAAAFTNPPVIDGVFPYFHITRHGLSLFFCTPALLFLLWPKQWSAFARNLLITAFIVALPDLFYQNTGWAQFGYRFALDFMPYLITALAVCGRPFTPGFWVAFGLSLAMNIVGALTFDRAPAFYYE